MLRGSITALVTPFADGAVDEKAFASFVDWQIREGSHGLVPVGTTGESPTLSHAEHGRVIEEVVKAAAGRIPVIAGAGSNNTAEGIDLIRHAEKVGADAALVVTPYYNKPTQRGLIAHFTALHDACTLPIIIYNIPGRSVVDMTPETMGELAKLPRIIGVKDATGKIERVSQQRASCGTDFVQLSGEDATALGFNAHGGVGCMPVGIGGVSQRSHFMSTLPKTPGLANTPDAMALLKALRRRWFLAGALGILCAAIVGAAAFVALPARYTAFALLQISSKPNPLVDRINNRDEFTIVMKTTAARLKSRDVLMRSLSQDAVRNLSIIKRHPDTLSTLTWMEESLKIEIQDNSELLTVALTGDEPGDLQVIVNNMVKSFMNIVGNEEKGRRRERLDKAKLLYEAAKEKLEK